MVKTRRCSSFVFLTLSWTGLSTFTVQGASSSSSSVVTVDCSNLRYSPINLVSNVLTLHAIVNPVDETLTAELVYVGQAWLSVGFAPVGKVTMKGVQAVTGFPDDALGLTNPGKYDMSAESMEGVVLMDDSRQTLVNSTIEQNNTHTVLRFTKPLVESNENEVSATGKSTLVWAYGSDNTNGYHANRGGFTSVLRQCKVMEGGSVTNEGAASGGGEVEIEDTNDNRTLWMVHGAMAAIAWAILVPLAIGSSMLRKLVELAFPSIPGLWFALHRGLNALAAISTLISFSIAVSIISQEPDAIHFSEITHNKLGLAIFILTMLQSLNGLLRPSLPHAPVEHPRSPTVFSVEGSDEMDAGDVAQEKAGTAPATESKSTLRVLWEYGHRILGLALLGMAWWQVQNGFGMYFERFADSYDLIPVFWGVVVGISVSVVGLFLMQKFCMKSST